MWAVLGHRNYKSTEQIEAMAETAKAKERKEESELQLQGTSGVAPLGLWSRCRCSILTSLSQRYH